MIRTILAAVLILGVFIARAQEGCPPPFGIQNEMKRYHVAAGVGLTNLYGDIDKAGTIGRSFFIKGDYQIKRGLYAGIEGQYGTLEAVASATDSREVKNNYLGGGIMVTFHPFEFFSSRQPSRQSIGYVIMDAFYLGVGVLGIISNYDSVYREVSFPATYGPIERYDDAGNPVWKKKSNSITLPTANVGFAFPVNRRYSKSGSYWSVLVNGQFNFANNDLLDGYMPQDGNGNRIGMQRDMFSFYSLGVRYSF